MWCPRCDQGNVVKVRINKTGEVVHICEECEALWQTDVKVAPTGFVDFMTYVTPFGLEGNWSELSKLHDDSK